MIKQVVFILLAASSAFAESEAGNGDGFTLVGDWPGNHMVLQLPQFSAQDIESARQSLVMQAPDPNLHYSDLFTLGDQTAFNDAQVNIIVSLHYFAKNILRMKQALVRGVVAINEGTQQRESSHQRVEIYRDYIRERMRHNIMLLNTTDEQATRDQIVYRLDESGKISDVGSIELSCGVKCVMKVKESIIGNLDGCEFDREDYDVPMLKKCNVRVVSHNYSLFPAAGICQSEACVFEIQKVAHEMLEQSFKLNEKVEFQNVSVNDIQLFWQPQAPALKSAMSRYISDKLTNRPVAATRLGITALSQLLYVPLIAPADFYRQLQVVKTSLDFYPGVYDRTDSDYGVDSYGKVVSQNAKDAVGEPLFWIASPLTIPTSLIALGVFSVVKPIEVLNHNPHENLRKRLDEKFKALAAGKLEGTMN